MHYFALHNNPDKVTLATVVTLSHRRDLDFALWWRPYLAFPSIVMSVASRSVAHLVLTIASAAVLLGAAGPVHAMLGERRASIDADRAHLRARLKSTAAGNYTVHELTLDGGALTREYTNGSGVVFAVSWQGPARPDLKQLFGSYFDRFQADTRPKGHVRMRRALAVHDVDFVVNTGGRPGAVWGYAVLPGAVPQGFDLGALQ